MAEVSEVDKVELTESDGALSTTKIQILILWDTLPKTKFMPQRKLNSLYVKMLDL